VKIIIIIISCGAFRVDGGRIQWRSKVGHVLNFEEHADCSIEKDSLVNDRERGRNSLDDVMMTRELLQK
jgi:hypothetical protein